jgi:hypothetical protein
MMDLSLRDWIVKGESGLLRLGATQTELRRSVGEPDAAGCPDRGEDTVWKYGDVELLFDPSQRPVRVFCVELHGFEGVPTGGSKVRLDPWIVRCDLPLDAMRKALAELRVKYREEPQPHHPTVIQLVVRDDPEFFMDFENRRGTLSLGGLWMTARARPSVASADRAPSPARKARR